MVHACGSLRRGGRGRGAIHRNSGPAVLPQAAIIRLAHLARPVSRVATAAPPAEPVAPARRANADGREVRPGLEEGAEVVKGVGTPGNLTP